ncbi:MAG: hypothetical protein U0470_03935, partial [Anaerolineae bacterium]
MDDEHWRLEAGGLAERVPGIQAGKVVPELAAHRAHPALGDVAGELRLEVGDAGVVHGAGVAIRSAAQPADQVAAVRAAGDRQARRVGDAAGDQQVRRRLDVAAGLIAPAAQDRLRERLTEAGRAVEVHEGHDITGSGERVRAPPPVPAVAERAVRAAVDHVHERPGLRGPLARGRDRRARGIDDEHLDRIAVRAGERHILDRAEVDIRHRLVREAADAVDRRADDALAMPARVRPHREPRRARRRRQPRMGAEHAPAGRLRRRERAVAGPERRRGAGRVRGGGGHGRGDVERPDGAARPDLRGEPERRRRARVERPLARRGVPALRQHGVRARRAVERDEAHPIGVEVELALQSVHEPAAVRREHRAVGFELVIRVQQSAGRGRAAAGRPRRHQARRGERAGIGGRGGQVGRDVDAERAPQQAVVRRLRAAGV